MQCFKHLNHRRTVIPDVVDVEVYVVHPQILQDPVGVADTAGIKRCQQLKIAQPCRSLEQNEVLLNSVTKETISGIECQRRSRCEGEYRPVSPLSHEQSREQRPRPAIVSLNQAAHPRKKGTARQFSYYNICLANIQMLYSKLCRDDVCGESR